MVGSWPKADIFWMVALRPGADINNFCESGQKSAHSYLAVCFAQVIHVLTQLNCRVLGAGVS